MIAFSFFGNIYWISTHTSIKGADVPNHLLFSIEYLYKLSDIINDPSLSFPAKFSQFGKSLTKPVPHAAMYVPNFTYLTTYPFYITFGRTLFAAKTSNLLYIIILIVSLFLIVRSQSSNFIGLLSVMLTLMYPLIFESLRQYGPDLPLTALTTLSILMLLRCNNFRNLKYSIILGLTVGIGMLIKGQLLLIILGPALAICVETIFLNKSIKKTKPNYIFNIIIFLIIVIAISSLWWGTHFIEAIKSFGHHVVDAKKIETGRTYFKVLFVQLKMLALSSIGLPLLFFSIFGTYFFLKSNIIKKYLFLAWIVVPIIIFTFISLETWPRYLMPVLPAIAAVTALGIHQIKKQQLLISIF